jgi:hypothetical protein
MRHVLIITIIVVTMIGMIFPSATATEFSPTLNYRIDEIPTFCTKHPSSDISDSLVAGEDWTEYAEYAVKYWESELKQYAEYPNVWTMNFEKISQYAEYPDSCTIIMEYEPYSPWWGVLGLFDSEDILEVSTKQTDADRIWIFDDAFTCIQNCENFDSHKIIKEVLVHEIGHSLGLGHFTYDNKEKNQSVENGQSKFPSIMYPFSSEFVPTATITSKDISKINSIYGTYGFYAFSENIPNDLFDEDVIIIPGIPISEIQPFKGISISEEKINIPKSKYDPKTLTLSGNMNDYAVFNSGDKITLQLFYPNGDIESFLVSLTSSGLFQLTFQIDNNYPIGTYTIEPSHRGVYSPEFKINFEILELGEEIILDKIIEEEITQTTKNYNYEVYIPKVVELSRDSNTIVSGHIIPMKNNLGDVSNIQVYLILRIYESGVDQYAAGKNYDYVISSTNVNDDLTFDFLVKINDLTSITDLNTLEYYYAPKIFGAVDNIERSYLHDSNKKPIIFFSDTKSTENMESIVVNEIKIPTWIKTNAGWWADGTIGDTTFITGIEFLVKEGIIKVDSTSQKSEVSKEIPTWIKTNAGWWADGTIGDTTFITGIEFLVKEGIIKVD